MKKVLLLFCFVFFLYPALAQKINIDSLTRVAITYEKNTKNAPTPNRDSLLKLFPSVKSTTARIKLIYEIIYDDGLLNPKQAFKYQKKVSAIINKENDPVSKAVILSELGCSYFGYGDITRGLKMIDSALKLAEKTGDKQALGIVYHNYSYCYHDDIYLSKLYEQKALKLSKASGDNLFVCFEEVNLSKIFQKQHLADSARFYLLKSFELAVQNHVYPIIAYNLIAIGVSQTDIKQKLKYYKVALKMPFTSKDSLVLCVALDSIASYYENRVVVDSALFYAKKGYNIANNLFLAKTLWPAAFLARLYKRTNADSALKYLNIYYTSRDSLYNIDNMRKAQYLAFSEQQRQQKIEVQRIAYQTRLQIYLLLLIITFLLVLAFIFWRNNRNKHRANVLLQKQKDKIQHTLKELKLTQQQLIQSEKMASLGELTAGIAHEIQNPLNFVNNFSEVSAEMLEEMELEIDKGDTKEAKLIAADIRQNLEKIQLHGKRADSIVKGMLQHSRAGNSTKENTDLNKLADEYLRLAYHGLRAKDKTFDTEIKTNFDNKLPLLNIVPQDIGRVFLNLFTNSFYAIQQKQKTAGDAYKPIIKVSTLLKGQFAEITVWDNGTGMPDAIKDKILQPFFTTKPTGEGTGLGLSLSYDIVVKEHNGEINVSTKENEYTEFTISIPI